MLSPLSAKPNTNPALYPSLVPLAPLCSAPLLTHGFSPSLQIYALLRALRGAPAADCWLPSQLAAAGAVAGGGGGGGDPPGRGRVDKTGDIWVIDQFRHDTAKGDGGSKIRTLLREHLSTADDGERGKPTQKGVILGVTAFKAESALTPSAAEVMGPEPWAVPCVDAVFVDEASQMLAGVSSMVLELLDPERCETDTTDGQSSATHLHAAQQHTLRRFAFASNCSAAGAQDLTRDRITHARTHAAGAAWC